MKTGVCVRGRKKVKLNPLVREILSFPDETGLTSLPLLLKHLQSRYSDLSPAMLFEQVEKTLLKFRGYWHLKLLIEGEQRNVPIWQLNCPWLDQFIYWDEVERHWVIRKQVAPVEDVMIQLTQGAVKDLRLYYQQAEERVKSHSK